MDLVPENQQGPASEELPAVLRFILVRPGQVTTLVWGVVLAALRVGHVGVPADAVRGLAYVFPLAAVLVAGRWLYHRARGWADQQGVDGHHLRVWLRCEIGLPFAFVAFWLFLRAVPDATIECVGSFVGYWALLVVSGGLSKTSKRVHHGGGPALPGAAAALLASPFARCTRNSLEGVPGAPAVATVLRVLGSTTPAGQSSAVLVVLAALILSVGLVNTPTTMRRTAETVFSTGAKESSKRKKGRPKQEATVAPAATSSVPQPTTPAPASSGPQRTATPTVAGATYAEACGTEPKPGEPASPPLRAAELHDLWLGPGGFGATVAGCAGLAARVPGHPGVWYVAGWCGGHVQSLGVSTAAAPPALLLQQAARFALGKAEAGMLLSSSERLGVGSGDLYVVDTTLGTYVLVRSRLTAAAAGPAADTCAPSSGQSARYTVVPPALATLWLDLARRGWTWPVETAAGPYRERHFAFRANTPSRDVVARATCRADDDCDLVVDGVVHTSHATAHLPALAILKDAPAP